MRGNSIKKQIQNSVWISESIKGQYKTKKINKKLIIIKNIYTIDNW